MLRKEFEEVKRRRRLLKASLDFDPFFETLRKKHRLSHWQTVELLQEKVQAYIGIAIKRTPHGRR